MANFSILNSSAYAAQPATATTYTPLCTVTVSTAGTGFINPASAGGARRIKLYDILVGTNGTPADNFMEWTVQRVTMGCTLTWVGSLSSVSSTFALDVADGGFQALAVVNTSAPSTTAFTTAGIQTWYVGVNQRASYRWVAAPGSELVAPAVSSATGLNGLSLGTRSAAYTGTATGNILFQEQ